MDEAILDAHVDLRLATLARHPLFAGGPRARDAIKEKLAPLHREGTVRAAEANGRITGVLAWRHDPDAWYGVPVSTVALDHELEWDARAWIDGVLDDELPRMEADLDLLLDVGYRHAYRAMRARGVGIDSLQLYGRPDVALTKLEDRSLPPAITLARMEPEHVRAVMDLSRATFIAEPQYCWFGANEGFLAYKQRELERDLEQPEHVQRVLIEDGRVVGHCSASVKDDPLWGPTAGMSLILEPHLRGRGFVHAIYRHLLEHAVRAGARVMKGGTSQPPVIRLGVRMQRPAYAFVLRRRATWPESHFTPYLPL
jgi:ribosomal protein S18 acetylase RimI-like enzyme